MLVNFNEMLLNAKKEKYAVPHFNINNLEWTKYILEECQNLNIPVILGVSEGAAKYMGGFNTITGMVKGLLKDLNITIPVCIHIDHGSSFEVCKKAIDAGFTSVMIDASRYELKENIKITGKTKRPRSFQERRRQPRRRPGSPPRWPVLFQCACHRTTKSMPPAR